ncbi:hypothetical protein HV819_01270 [Anaerococcus sp. AGMB00486]|uniref:Holin n=2 Tax=Anaerococcus TaxID=165779 RepID=A0ABX2N7V0_9FIRM|nr:MULTISPECIES: hypothetical protein [Anaerococcus]MSS76867.1 hypothetical protein [Anaerococcus porci]NVF10649.1 hypothetical protein [Anaerococcus faecalis]
MTGLINLVVDNFSSLIILPILTMIIIAITVVISKTSESRSAKFYPSIAFGIVSIVLAIFSYINFTKDIGLNVAFVSISLATASIVGIITAVIINLIDGLKLTYKDNNK